MKVFKKKEEIEEYDLCYIICDFCSDKIETDNIKINHIFTSKSQIAPGNKIEIDVCEHCFLNKIYNQLNYDLNV